MFYLTYVIAIVVSYQLQPISTDIDDQALEVLGWDNFCDINEYMVNGTCNYIATDETEGEQLTQNCNETLLLCDSGFPYKMLEKPNTEIKRLQIRNWPGKCLDFTTLQQYFPNLIYLELNIAEELDRINGRFDQHNKIQSIVMRNWSKLLELPAYSIIRMKDLKLLDMRRNGVRHIKPDLIKGPPNLETILLRENRWDCSDGGLDWLAMEPPNGKARTRIKDYTQMWCHQRLFKGKPLPQVMKIIRTVRRTCPSVCACNMTHVVWDPTGTTLVPIITVDCSYRSLSTPPATLPPNTTVLKLQGNEIDTIRMMVQNPHYRHVSDLYLDNNKISSLKELEATEWLNNFRILSLRWNYIRQVPMFAFNNAFQQNPNLAMLFLGYNPWRCDCHYTPLFQDFLLKYNTIIQDLQDITCSEPLNGIEPKDDISTINVQEFCSKKSRLIDPLIITNLILGSLIVILLTKFFYDYYRYKRTGKLPWLSTIL